MLARFRFLASARWLALTAAAVCVIVVCALLAQWQWGRAEQRAEANDRIASPGGPVALDTLAPAGAGLDPDDRWRLTEVAGTYDTEHEIVLRARTNDGANGFEIVTPLMLEDGTALLVNRGFVAGDGSNDVPDYPDAPDGEVTVVGRVYESEPSGGEVSAERGHLLGRRLNLDQIGGHLDYDLRGAWAAQTDPQEGFTALQPPSFRAWQNYSYTVQWALFAALVPIGWVVLVRRELRGEADGAVGTGPAPAETGDAATDADPAAAGDGDGGINRAVSNPTAP